ncbi:MAG: ATP-binding protein [Pseudomonadota bacterium]
MTRPAQILTEGPHPEEIVRAGLEVFAARRGSAHAAIAEDWDAMVAALRSGPLPPALGRLAAEADLDAADVFLLSLVGGVEADLEIALAVRALQGDGAPAAAQFHLAAALRHTLFGRHEGPLDLLAHPLLRAGLLTIGPGDAPTPFRTLATRPALWAVLTCRAAEWPNLRAIPGPDQPVLGSAAETEIARRAAALAEGEVRALLFRGGAEAADAAAIAVADALGLQAVRAPFAEWKGDPALAAACRYGGWMPLVSLSLSPGEQVRLEPHPFSPPVLFHAGRDGALSLDGLVELRLPCPSAIERVALWAETLDGDAAERLGRTAILDGAQIHALGADAKRLSGSRPPGVADTIRARQSRGTEALLRIAAPVERTAPETALVLTPAIRDAFDRLTRRALSREAAWGGLGPAAADENRGVHALFTGPSGTGKTLAASALAARLGMPLYRLDLSNVLNKYIGETEKSLSAALDAAAELDVLLLLDEADALFGRRTDGEGEGERFGNILTNFLLTRIESHPGLVVLTSNARARIDTAFTRRLHAIIEFPEPGFEERVALWSAHLGARSPGPEAVRHLAAQCDLAGGFVRTAVLAAASEAPGGAGVPIPTADLAAAALVEYRKLGRTVPAGLVELAG